MIHNNGTHRYKKDTYYGGGEWLLLSSWIGWYYSEIGSNEKANRMKLWVEKQVDKAGNLPEQVCSHVNDEVFYPYWVSKWGIVASPLLWSHAMYLILCDSLRKKLQIQSNHNKEKVI